ncbi:VOC family protein [Mucilaginibacter daejeonensis]|uniref:VOC family protein n=1 Tax=Mucilaginibacter daejeonensis TaxID=398049 RepID=UPI001D17841E|nr:VOC family protein [Mucilaginibacter daejeonensis]UEG54608.1 VOC family protein [Mucilaginibacter daejeonensis]
MQKITTFLWFDQNAEEAVNYYVSIFKDSQIKHIQRYGENMPLPAGTVLTVSFRLNEMDFIAMNGGPYTQFTPAVSFMIECETQDEIDHYWDHLLDGGKAMQCGWLTDKFGVTWQITPKMLLSAIGAKDPKKAAAATQAMMKMVKLDIAELQRAYDEA